MIHRAQFSGLKGLKDVIINDSLIHIEPAAFFQCVNLTSITLPDTLKKIAKDAFKGCISLEPVDLPESLESFGKNAFLGCTELKTLYVNSPELAKKIQRNRIKYGLAENITIIAPTKRQHKRVEEWAKLLGQTRV